MVTRTYRLDHDLGFAPNPFFGWCTLACCMPQIRKYANLGDIIVGIAGSGKRGLGRYHPRVIYWMRVDETLTFDQYWHDDRFVNKRPQIPGPKLRMVGDRTYRHESGNNDWYFETSMHYLPGASQRNGGHVNTDTKVDRVLLGKSFSYWGKSGPEVPAHLMSLFPNPRGQKCPKNEQLLAELHELIDINNPRPIVEDPADWDNPRYFNG
ncbi:hypothetical protein [Methylocella sp. CPCC 101449]|uniref:Nmad2 family putative nucleotide modification protein n=1 Tax=Methylocella sp. CPCC 101449 TaxID=2987531 RepID=UPI00288CCA77|nr:hypothetical protein [Methylocella sp. CPCC 101449]MDT2022302.1 hypothetical protein [Methylocella sp. CPCC 101449]